MNEDNSSTTDAAMPDLPDDGLEVAVARLGEIDGVDWETAIRHACGRLGMATKNRKLRSILYAIESGDPKVVDQMASRARSHLQSQMPWPSELGENEEMPAYDVRDITMDEIDRLEVVIAEIQNREPLMSADEWVRNSVGRIACCVNQWIQQTGSTCETVLPGRLAREAENWDERRGRDPESLILWGLGVAGLPKAEVNRLRNALKSRARRRLEEA